MQPVSVSFSPPLLIYLLPYTFLWFGIHNRKGLGIYRIFIYERNNHVVKQNQSAPRLGIGYMGKLFF